MKKPLFLVLFIAFVTCFAGCTKMLLYSYGVRNPKIENEQSIKEYAQKQGMDTDNIYAYRDTVVQSLISERKRGVPEMDFYNKDGYLMNIKNPETCNAQNDGLINSLGANNPSNTGTSASPLSYSANEIKIDTTRKLLPYLANLRTLDGKELDQNEFTGYDYYIIVYWVKWAGISNKSHVPRWEKEARMKIGLKIKLIAVTTDYMDFWHPDSQHLFKIYDQKLTSAN